MKSEVLEFIPRPFRRPRGWFATGGEVEITHLQSGETEQVRFSEPFGLDVIKDRIRKETTNDINRFLFDFSHITVLNALFIGAIVNWKKLAEDRGARVAFFGMNDGVRSKFARTQARDFLTIFESREEALESLEG
jgi:anti-anti-sigma regulatory factor